MDKQQICLLVEAVIKEHPDWMASIIMSLQYGIEQRLENEMQYSTDIEIAFADTFKRKNKQQKELRLKGLRALRRLGKTKFQEEEIKKITN